jgi:nitroreductase
MTSYEFVEIRLVCKADYLDPQLKIKLQEIREKLRQLLHTGRRRFALKKVQPWNSIKVTFDIPKDAADRLRLLAIEGNIRLIDLGIISVEIVGQSNPIVVNNSSTITNSMICFFYIFF